MANQKRLKIGLVLLANLIVNASAVTLLLGFEHGRGAVSVIGTNVDALVVHHALKSDPDVGLDMLI